MDIKNKNKEELLKKLKQRLEDSWSGFTQVIEEAEEFIEDIREAEDKEQIEFKDVEELEIFYEDYIDNLKFQADAPHHKTHRGCSQVTAILSGWHQNLIYHQIRRLKKYRSSM